MGHHGQTIVVYDFNSDLTQSSWTMCVSSLAEVLYVNALDLSVREGPVRAPLWANNCLYIAMALSIYVHQEVLTA